MKYTLDGVEANAQEKIAGFIDAVLQFAFEGKQYTFIEEVIIPSNIIDKVRELQNEEGLLGNDYIPPAYGDLAGKVFSKSGKVRILLSNTLYSQGYFSPDYIDFCISNGFINEEQRKEFIDASIIQRGVLYHEIVHAKNYMKTYELYKDFENFLFPCERLYFFQALYLWDEFRAVKQTETLFYLIDKNVDLIKDYIRVCDDYTTTKDKIKKFAMVQDWDGVQKVAICYVAELLRYFATAMGIYDAFNIVNDLDITQNIDAFGDELLLLKNKLMDIGDIPRFEQLLGLSNYIDNIYAILGVGFKKINEEKNYVYLR